MKTTRTTEKPEWWTALEARFAELQPSALPPTPWVLERTAPGRAMSPLGGPFVRVTNNEAYLKSLRADLAEGPGGPRGHVVIGDLESLRVALSTQEKTSANHGTADQPA